MPSLERTLTWLWSLVWTDASKYRPRIFSLTLNWPWAYREHTVIWLWSYREHTVSWLIVPCVSIPWLDCDHTVRWLWSYREHTVICDHTVSTPWSMIVPWAYRELIDRIVREHTVIGLWSYCALTVIVPWAYRELIMSVPIVQIRGLVFRD